MTAREGKSLKESQPGRNEFSEFRFENAACCDYIPTGCKGRNLANGFSPGQPLIGGRNLLLTRECDSFDRQPLYGAGVGRSGFTKSTGDMKSIVIHAAPKHGVCFQQRESRRP